MAKKKKNIGLFGGMFDPIHMGHLNCANQAAELFGLDIVYFLPTAVAPHGKKGKAKAEDRFTMTQIAILDNPRFELSRYEMDKRTVAYTIDTVRAFKKRLKCNIFFILGLDAFEEIHTWKSAGRLLRECNFIVIPRPGSISTDTAGKLETNLSKKNNHIRLTQRSGGPCGEFFRVAGTDFGLYLCKAVELDISSTGIRKKIGKGESIKYIVPASVEQYILKERIYR